MVVSVSDVQICSFFTPYSNDQPQFWECHDSHLRIYRVITTAHYLYTNFTVIISRILLVY